MPQIVNVSVSQLVAPAPDTLQKTACVLSVGGTILAPNAKQLITRPSDLTPYLMGAQAISNIVYSAGLVTVTTAQPHQIKVGESPVPLTIAGCTPAGYNGTFNCAITGASTFTYPLPASPGSATVFGMYTPEDVGELTSAISTFFTQGSFRSVYVLELGEQDPADAVAALQAYVTATPNAFYAYLVPRNWDNLPAYLAFLPQFNGTTGKTYFFTTTTLATYGAYPSTFKSVVLIIEAPQYGTWSQNALAAISWNNGQVTATTANAHGVSVGDWFQLQGCVPAGYNGYAQALPGTQGSTIVYALGTNPGAETRLGTLVASYASSSPPPSTEMTAGAFLWKAVSYDPKSTNKVAPYNYSFLYGVTPFPQFQNNGLLATLKAANVNVVLTGAQGGITNTIIYGGTTADGRKWNYWYAVDWLAINSGLRLTNAIINGSNDPTNPLYYNQAGINRLEGVQASVVNDGVAFGLILFTAIEQGLDGPDLDRLLDAGAFDGYSVVNAVPFIPYSQENPGDYEIGQYDGLSATVTPTNGFDTIQVNLVISDFVAP